MNGSLAKTQTSFERLRSAFYKRVPASLNQTIQRLAWASLISQVLLIVTGGAVRLTSSGLGCPTWPRCTAESFTATPEMGVHGVIEFGNRLLTFVLVVIAFAMVASLLKIRKERRDLWIYSIVLLAGIPLQAIIGGITVLTNLNPWIVGLHFLVSGFMIAVSTLLVRRTYDQGDRGTRLGSNLAHTLSGVQLAIVGLVVVLGVIVTGSGPHAGDAESVRNGLDPEVITRVHAIPVYLLVAITIVSAVLLYRGLPLTRKPFFAVLALISLEAVQAIVGITQFNLGLPVLLVGLHMLLAGLMIVAAVWAYDSLTVRSRLQQA